MFVYFCQVLNVVIIMSSVSRFVSLATMNIMEDTVDCLARLNKQLAMTCQDNLVLIL